LRVCLFLYGFLFF